MKKSSLTIILIILIVLLVMCGGLLALIILGESVMENITEKFERGELRANILQTDCPTCNNNPLDTQECITFLQENRNDPQIAKANVYGFDINNIKSVEKRLILTNFQEKTIRCTYHN